MGQIANDSGTNGEFHVDDGEKGAMSVIPCQSYPWVSCSFIAAVHESGDGVIDGVGPDACYSHQAKGDGQRRRLGREFLDHVRLRR